MSNLRILYDNVANRATLSAPYVGNLLPANLKSSKRSKVWRTSYTTGTTLNSAWNGVEDINCIVLASTNISLGAVLTINIKNNMDVDIYTKDYTLVQEVGKYIVIYLPSVYSVKSASIHIEDTNNTSGYLEVGKLIVGKYWEPKYNTGFGMSISMEDSTTVERADSGDLIIARGVKGRKLSFELPWMDSIDRDQFNNIVTNNSKSEPVFVSLFPNSLDLNKEKMYEFYGPMSQDVTLTHTMHTMYSGRVDITEI